MKLKIIKNKIIQLWNLLKRLIIGEKQQPVFWKNPSTDPLLNKEPHNCGMIAIQEIFPQVSIEKLKEAFLFCCEKWPHDGAKKRDMNIVLKYLNLYDKLIYKDVSKEKISLDHLIKNSKKTYMVLFPNHYLVIKNGIIIDPNGEYYYKQKNKIVIHCYWELIN